MDWRNAKDWKDLSKKVWHFIWEDNSWESWLVNVLLAFIIIKFLVYPVIGLALGTSFPVVAVISESMEHQGNFEEWWNSPALCEQPCSQSEFYAQYNITAQQFNTFTFKDGMNTGDIIVLKGIRPENVAVGDVLIFSIGQPTPIIHRIINIWTEQGRYYFTTKGDHNQQVHPGIGEARISEQQIIGVAAVRIPLLGYVKIYWTSYIVNPLVKYVIAPMISLWRS